MARIKTLRIRQFKSILDMEIPCRRVNLFIGEPNVGKSNILEALALCSWSARPGISLKDFIRFQSVGNLFYDGLTDTPISVKVSFEKAPVDDWIEIILYGYSDGLSTRATFASSQQADYLEFIALNQQDGGGNPIRAVEGMKDILFYRFAKPTEPGDVETGPLLPPHGSNLFSAVYGTKQLREKMAALFSSYPYKMVMKPQERKFEIQKRAGDVVTALPLSMASDTLLRVMFYEAAMTSNHDSVLVFEEPEAHAFPYFTKQMGERLALADSNQYFIATHNPYLLTAVLEKAQKNDVNVFVVYQKDFETRLLKLSEEGLSEMLSGDPFFMCGRFVEGTAS